MVAIDQRYPSVQLKELINQTLLSEKMAPAVQSSMTTETQSVHAHGQTSGAPNSKLVSPSQFGLDGNNPSLQFATQDGGFVQVFGPLKTPGNDKFFSDPNPIIIRKQSKPVTYVQKVNLAYYKPPAPPAPGPVIIKEVRPPQAPAPPPLFVRIQPPPPPVQQPMVIREAPPPRPKHVPATVLTKVLPAPPAPRDRVTVRTAPNHQVADRMIAAYNNGSLQQ